ncbi:MAG TPA: hypothetical protein VFQ00_06395, partial [Terriglobales bacterium]|nr:hypothetical protein [Terriglobales bacterium]
MRDYWHNEAGCTWCILASVISESHNSASMANAGVKRLLCIQRGRWPVANLGDSRKLYVY